MIFFSMPKSWAKFVIWIKNAGFVMLFLLTSCKPSNNTLFTLLDADDTGVEFNNFVEEDAENNVLKYGYFYNGGGVAAGDFNNDGFIDLYFTGNMVPDKLYFNKGNKNGEPLGFEDVTEAAGIKHNGWKTGVSVVDINNDGWLDIYVCRSGAEDPNLRKNLLYINDGKGKFAEKAAEYGLDDDSYTTQAAFFDYDHDGDLDCFLLNHSIQQYAGFSTMIANYRQQADKRYGCKLLKNNGKEGFKDVSSEAGLLNNVLSFGLGINVSDLNNDGWLDMYVSNDYNENDYLYINQKSKMGQHLGFKEMIRESMGHTSLYSMGTDAADINNDGLTDIFTLDMLPEHNDRIKLTSGDDNYDKYKMLVGAGFHDQTMRNMLQVNQGNGTFVEIGQLAGVSNTDWSWSALFADFDNDGLKDLFVSNGYARDYTNMEFLKFSTDTQAEAQAGKAMPTHMDIIKKMPSIDEPNYIFKNKDGLTFEKKIEDWGFQKKSQSNGAIYADLDNDGDLDLVTNNINEKAFIYQNNSNVAESGYLQVNLESPTEALKIGAKVAVWSAGKAQYQEFQPTRGFQSAMYVPLHFGLGKNLKIDSVSVNWTDGKQSILKNIKANTKLEINYTTNRPQTNAHPLNSSLFSYQPSLLFSHLQTPTNDFKIQTLLPEMHSYSGPCMAKADLNNDGLEDVYVGGGRGQGGALFLQNSKGFTKINQPDFDKDAAFEDADAVFFDADGDKDLDLIVVGSGYALNANDALLQARYYVNQNGKFTRAQDFLQLNINASVVANADVDADGDQDVFIGANCVSGRFPEAQKSVLLQNNGKGQFTLNALFTHSSLITDAVFTDVNNDKKPDLLLVGQWMSPTLYLNQNGKLQLSQINTQTSIAHSVIAADLDNDGDDDFVIGNEGINSQYNITSDKTLRLYAGNFADNGNVVPVITLLENGKEYPYASRDELLDQIPSLKKKYQDYLSYSTATINDILTADQLKNALKLTANELRSGILWNDGGKFSFSALPIQAQYAPVYAIAVSDLNNDGKKDIILGGNISHTRVRLGKCDANLGQVFLNQGKRNFSYLPQLQSGLNTKGDNRSLLIINNKWLLCGINGQPIISYRKTF